MSEKIAVLISGRHHHDLIKQTLLEQKKAYPVYEVSGSLESRDGIQQAKALQEEGVRVIISAGMNAVNILQHVTIPVICIQRSRLSLALTLKKALESVNGDASQIALVCSSGLFLEAAKKAREVFEFNIHIQIYSDSDNLIAILQQLKDQGVTTIIGPSVVLHGAESLGMQTVPAPLEKEDILQAVEQAEEHLQTIENYFQNNEIIRVIQNSTPYGILAADREHRLLEINEAAMMLFGVEKSQVFGLDVFSTLFSSNSIKEPIRMLEQNNDQILTIRQDLVLVHLEQIQRDHEIIAYVYTMKPISQIQQEEERTRKQLHKKGSSARGTFDNIIGSSPAMQKAIHIAKRIAQVNSTILICGQTGCGKELFAQSIHNYSPRRSAPFVVINCAALPESILESILFGYEPGAFTGAQSRGKQGLFEIAHNGTVFLDEISEMPLNTQARFLRVLQEREVMRLGSDKAIPVDIRVIAATNKNLAEMVSKNLFRQDLFYRINVLTLQLPPLSQREGDLRLLTDYFIARKARDLNRPVSGIQEEAFQYLSQYPLPGNIRQLSNIVEAAVALSDTDRITKDVMELVLAPHIVQPQDMRVEGDLGQAEAAALWKALKQNHFQRMKTAQALQISSSTLWRKIKKYHLDEKLAELEAK